MTRNNRFVIFAAALALAVVTAWPAEAAPQSRGRAVRRPAGRTAVVVRRAPYYRGYYSAFYSPFYSTFYSPFYSPYAWGTGGWYGWGYQYPYPPYYYPRYYNYEPGVDLRIQVEPKDAEVYLDGYLVGTVDDFDGIFQRLRVPYGEHEIAIYFQGYRTIQQKMLFRPGESYHIKEVMQPVPQGEAPEPRPTPSATTPSEAPARGRPPVYGRNEPPMRGGREPGMPPPAEPVGDFGTLAIRVQPAGAEIRIDGERWDTPAGEDRLTVDLAEGTHHVEITQEGHKPYSGGRRDPPRTHGDAERQPPERAVALALQAPVSGRPPPLPGTGRLDAGN